MLEEDVAFSSIAQNEIGHARAIYQLLSEDADALAFDRKPDEYRCSQLVELRFVPDWARTIARRVLYEAADELRLRELMASDDAAVAGLAGEDRQRRGLPPDARRDVARAPAGRAALPRSARGAAPARRRSAATHDRTSWPALWEEMTEVRRSVPGAAW